VGERCDKPVIDPRGRHNGAEYHHLYHRWIGRPSGFTGIDDPYEPPERPEIRLDTVNHTPEENARIILDHLMGKGLVRAPERVAVLSANS
jgi:hypothetical protein